MDHGKLTQKQLEAAQYIAFKTKKMTLAQIAEKLGVSDRTLDYWKADEDFKAEVNRLKNLWRKTIRTTGVADPEIRLHDLNDLRNRIFGIIYARANDPEMQQVPGGRTGLLVKSVKMRPIGMGESVAEPEYKFDRALVDAIIDIDREVSRQLKGDDEDPMRDVATEMMRQLDEGRRRAAEAKKFRVITTHALPPGPEPPRT